MGGWLRGLFNTVSRNAKNRSNTGRDDGELGGGEQDNTAVRERELP
jgi:hypothetical protein